MEPLLTTPLVAKPPVSGSAIASLVLGILELGGLGPILPVARVG